MDGDEQYGLERIREYIGEAVRGAYGEWVRSPDAFVVAKHLGIERQQALEMPGGRRGAAPVLSIRDEEPGGDWFVYHDMAARRERQQFDVAHEIIEQRILDRPELLEPFRPDAAELNADDFRELAHRLACYCTRDFLINPETFEADFHDCVGDLLRLKQRYPQASHEVLAYATLPLLEQGAILTILDEPRGAPRYVYRRVRSTMQPVHEPLTAAEREVAEACFDTAETQRERRELHVEAWGFAGWAELRAFPVFEPQWRRVILYLIAEEIW